MDECVTKKEEKLKFVLKGDRVAVYFGDAEKPVLWAPATNVSWEMLDCECEEK